MESRAAIDSSPLMARPPKYPLESLLGHRERRVEDATAELGDAVRAREAAETAKARAEAARREEEERAARVRAEEAERLARGELRAVDLARAQAWEHAEQATLEELAAAERRAAGHAGEARAAEDRRRADLAKEKADHDVVAKDQARFVDRVRREREAQQEEEAGEAWAGGRKAP